MRVRMCVYCQKWEKLQEKKEKRVEGIEENWNSREQFDLVTPNDD